MFTDILWRFLILETFVFGALCSSRCPYKHPQTWFCTSDYVLKGIFHEVKDLSGATGYMEIQNVFKGDLKELNGYVRLETATHLNYLDGRRYLLSGREKNGKIYSDMCFKDMELFSKYGYFFRQASKIGCDCMNEIGKYSDAKSCHWKHSYMKKVGKHCKWVQTRNFKFCQNVWGDRR